MVWHRKFLTFQNTPSSAKQFRGPLHFSLSLGDLRWRDPSTYNVLNILSDIQSFKACTQILKLGEGWQRLASHTGLGNAFIWKRQAEYKSDFDGLMLGSLRWEDEQRQRKLNYFPVKPDTKTKPTLTAHLNRFVPPAFKKTECSAQYSLLDSQAAQRDNS